VQAPSSTMAERSVELWRSVEQSNSGGVNVVVTGVAGDIRTRDVSR
jgi:hypothetical protein